MTKQPTLTRYANHKYFFFFLIAVSALLAAACKSDSGATTAPTPPADTVWTFEQMLVLADSTPIYARQTVVDSFLNYWSAIAIPPVHVAPDSEFGTAAFVLTTTSTPTVAGDFNGWDPKADHLSHLDGTTLYYLVKRFEKNARFDYKFVLPGNNWILDPRNPRTLLGGFGPNSQMWMPAYSPPVETANDTSVAHGSLSIFSLHSAILNNDHEFGDAIRWMWQ